MKASWQSLMRSVGMRHGLILSAAMIFAGALDYVANVLVGRWLTPVEFGVFVSVAAILQIFLYLSIAIRNVVAFYTAELTIGGKQSSLGVFVQRAWRWAWQWGLVATALMALLSVPSGRLLRLPNSWPLWAATPMILALFLRPITDGALQGMQAFGRMGLVHASQACLRLLFTAGLIWLGLRSVGAIFALPLACFAALVLARAWLRPEFRDAGEVVARSVSWHYSAHTLLGLAVFGMLVNLDALFVKRFFSPAIAGNYGPVVTLSKVCLFLPLAMGIIVLPKAKLRQATGRDARPVLLMALAGVLVPGVILAMICFLYPGALVRTVFGAAYANPSIILGLACLAAGLYAGLNIWLNYALSLERPAFIYALLGVLLLQGLCMFLFGRSDLVYMTFVMVMGGLLGNLAGFITTWSIVPVVKVARTETVGS
jgi:O-antigen/teichoic acid export membrane protein